MRARNNPHTISGCTSPQLELEVEAMNPRIPIGVVPMDLTILMPGDRGTETRFLYKQDLVEGREVGTIDGFGHPQQIWMPVDTQERLTDFEAAADEKRHVGRGALGRRRLVHFHLMPAVQYRLAAPWITERFCHEPGVDLEVES